MTGFDEAPQKHVHKQADYAALDGKELAPEILDSILTGAENGLPLTDEQAVAIGLRHGGTWITPRLGVQWTEAQVDAFFGGREERIRKARRFTAELLPSTIMDLKEAIATGKRYKRDEYWRKMALNQMLAMAEKELHLLKTTAMTLQEIEKYVTETTHVRRIYLLPRFGELTIMTPYDTFRFLYFYIIQKDGKTYFHRVERNGHKRWERIIDTEFEYKKPEPEPADTKRRNKTTDSSTGAKKPRKRKSVLIEYRLAFRKRIDIHPTMNVHIGNARALVNAAAVEHRKTLRDRLKTTRSPNNEMLITTHAIESERGSHTLILASIVKRVTWISDSEAVLYLDIAPSLEESYVEWVRALDTLNKRWDQPEPAREVT